MTVTPHHTPNRGTTWLNARDRDRAHERGRPARGAAGQEHRRPRRHLARPGAAGRRRRERAGHRPHQAAHHAHQGAAEELERAPEGQAAQPRGSPPSSRRSRVPVRSARPAPPSACWVRPGRGWVGDRLVGTATSSPRVLLAITAYNGEAFIGQHARLGAAHRRGRRPARRPGARRLQPGTRLQPPARRDVRAARHPLLPQPAQPGHPAQRLAGDADRARSRATTTSSSATAT